MYNDYSKIYLTFAEKRKLKSLRKRKQKIDTDKFWKLLKYKLIESDFVCQNGNMPVSTETYFISKQGEEYLTYRKSHFVINYVPIIISITSLVGGFRAEFLFLLQAIGKLLK